MPAEAAPLLEHLGALYELSRGAVSPLVGRSLETLGYDAHYTLRPRGDAHPAPRWEDALAWDGARLTTLTPVVLDVGAAGKGQLVDLVAALVREAGVEAATVDASGDLHHRGGRPLRIGLEHPQHAGHAIGVAELAEGGFAASATNRRAWGAGLHHVLDATTGLPVHRYRASWVLAREAMVADGAATALLIVDPDTAQRLPAALGGGVSWARMRADGRVESSPDFPAELFWRERQPTRSE